MQNNKYKVVLLLAPFSVLLVGVTFVYVSELAYLICGTNYCRSVIGFPFLSLAKWLVLAFIIIFFAREGMLRYWQYFAGITLVLATIAIIAAPVSPFWGKDAMAELFGMAIAGVTIVWVIIDRLVIKFRIKAN